MSTIAQQLEELLKHPVNRTRFYDACERYAARNWEEQAPAPNLDMLTSAIAYVEQHNEAKLILPSDLTKQIQSARKLANKKAAAEETIINILDRFTEADVHSLAPKAIVNRLEEITAALLT